MKNYQKEIVWFVVLCLISILLSFYMGIGFGSHSIDINLHDTYFLVKSNLFFFICCMLVFYPVYLVRILIGRLENLIANCIFLTLNFLLTLVMVFGTIFQYKLAGETIYPPLSAVPVEVKNGGLGNFFYISIAISLLVIALEIFIARKTLTKNSINSKR